MCQGGSYKREEALEELSLSILFLLKFRRKKTGEILPSITDTPSTLKARDLGAYS